MISKAIVTRNTYLKCGDCPEATSLFASHYNDIHIHTTYRFHTTQGQRPASSGLLREDKYIYIYIVLTWSPPLVLPCSAAVLLIYSVSSPDLHLIPPKLTLQASSLTCTQSLLPIYNPFLPLTHAPIFPPQLTLYPPSRLALHPAS